MSEPAPLICPLCRSVPLAPRARARWNCPTHGDFLLIGLPLAEAGRVGLTLEHATTGLKYEDGVLSLDEWLRLVGPSA